MIADTEANAPRVSVVIKSYNHADFVAQTLRSVLDQSFQDFEIVVTDDASSDRTADVIRAFTDPRIKLEVAPENRGIAASMNATIARARGEFIAILNSDDYALPTRLARQVAFLDTHPQIGALFTMVRTVDENDRPTLGFFDFREALKLPDFKRPTVLRHLFFSGNFLCAPSAMIRRAVYARLGPYDTRLTNLQDYDMWVRLAAETGIHVLDEELTAFRIRSGDRNASAPRRDNTLRTQFEFSRILERYRLLPHDVLREAFAADLQRAGIDARGEPDLWLARLALTIPSGMHHLFAVETLFERARSDQQVREIRDILGRIDLFGTAALDARDRHIAKLDAELSRSGEEVRALQARLAALTGSRSWRYTAPVRAALQTLRSLAGRRN